MLLISTIDRRPLVRSIDEVRMERGHNRSVRGTRQPIPQDGSPYRSGRTRRCGDPPMPKRL
jgi:hypothetical protein